jgi:hypothetical protein
MEAWGILTGDAYLGAGKQGPLKELLAVLKQLTGHST